MINKSLKFSLFLGLLVVALPMIAQELPKKLDETWTITANGQSVQADPDGGFLLRNIIATDRNIDGISDDWVWVMGTRVINGITQYAFAPPLRLEQGQTSRTADISFTNTPPPIPNSLSFINEEDTVAINEQIQMNVTGALGDGNVYDMSHAESGTLYRLSNNDLADINADGLLTPKRKGPIFVTATNRGVTTVKRFTIVQVTQSTRLTGIAVLPDGSPVAGAEITALGETTNSNADGSFGLEIPDLITLEIPVTICFENEIGEYKTGLKASAVVGGITNLGTIQLQPFQRTLYGTSSVSHSQMGYSIDRSGDYLITGAPWSRNWFGHAFIFHRGPNGWEQQALLGPPSQRKQDWFGLDVAIEDDIAVVASRRGAYVYQRNGSKWTLQATLTTYSVSNVEIQNGFVLFTNSRPRTLDILERQGNNWVLAHSIPVPIATSWGNTFNSVAIDGDVMILGLSTNDTVNDNAGSAYIYRHNGTNWEMEATLYSPDARVGEYFGDRVAIHGNYALISSRFSSPEFPRAVHFFEHIDGSWVHRQKFTGSQWNENFGRSLAIHNDLALVAAPNRETSTGVWSGGVYVFKLENGIWFNSSLKTDENPQTQGAYFGSSLYLDDELAFIGAIGLDGYRGAVRLLPADSL